MSVGFRPRLEGQPVGLPAHAFGRSPIPKLVLSITGEDHGAFAAVNDAFCDPVGYSRDALVGQPCEITVEDSGPGVPEEFRDRLFERLARADRDATSVKGTGLGLSIVRGLAQANHGDIRHEPNPAGGSRFVISLESPGPDRE
jgi:signal transduction histidine kinase